MSSFDNVIEDDLMFYALKAYYNQHLIDNDEFLSDFNKPIVITKLLHRYYKKKELKYRLILNHIITMQNVFGVPATVHILHRKVPQYLHVFLNSFLAILKYLDDLHIYDIELYNNVYKKLNVNHR